MRGSRAIRAGAWALVAAGVAAPALRRRMTLPRAGVMAAAAAAVPATALVVGPGRRRIIAVGVINMWAYLAAYELPHDRAEELEARVRIDYPIAVDRVLGLGVPPTVRLQRGLANPDYINRFERVLVWCHWVWFAVPHATLAYVGVRRPDRFGAAVARMYAVFDLGAVFYWTIPTAPPWYAARHGRLHPGPGENGSGRALAVRRMMIEYGEQFWGDRWPALYDVLGGNPLAAMPSLHFATSLMGAHLLSEVGPVAGAVGWLYAATLGLALVYLGEHYAADLVAGAVLAETVRTRASRVAPLAGHVVEALDMLSRRTGGG